MGKRKVLFVVVWLMLGLLSIGVAWSDKDKGKSDPAKDTLKTDTPAAAPTEGGSASGGDKKDVNPTPADKQSPQEKEAWINKLVQKLQNSSDVWVKVESVKKLGELNDPKTLPTLKQALQNESVDVNVEAIRALGKIGDAEAFDLLTQGTLVYGLRSLRFYSVRAAAQLDYAKTLTFLQRNLNHQNQDWRKNAAESLDHLYFITKHRPKAVVAGIVESLKTADDETKGKMDEVLKDMTGVSFNGDDGKWAKWVEENQDKIESGAPVKGKITGTPEDQPKPKEKKELTKKEKEQVAAKKQLEKVREDKIIDKKDDDKVAAYFAGRDENDRMLAIKAFGGDIRMYEAVEDALNWLHRHQEKEGFWSYKGYSKNCTPKTRDDTTELKGDYDVAMTGLALLAFLGAGHTHMPGQKVGLPEGGKYKPTVERGLKWLMKIQQGDGSFHEPGHNDVNMFEQAIATLAISEAYGMTGDDELKPHVERAVRFISQAKNPNRAWRYRPRGGDNDTSVTGWQVFALKSAYSAGLTVKREDFSDASQWLDDMTDMVTGHVGYNKKGQGSPTITAVGMMCRMLLGWRTDSPVLKEGAKIILADQTWKGKEVNFYHIYQASLAMFQMGGKDWETWHAQMTKFLLDNQVQHGCELGSWDPSKDTRCKNRVFTTALGALSLEVYYRYLPFAQIDEDAGGGGAM